MFSRYTISSPAVEPCSTADNKNGPRYTSVARSMAGGVMRVKNQRWRSRNGPDEDNVASMLTMRSGNTKPSNPLVSDVAAITNQNSNEFQRLGRSSLRRWIQIAA